METIIIILSGITGYYFALKGVFEKENKEKIFYIVFMTIVFFLTMMIIKMLGFGFLNYFLFFIFYFVIHSFYTNFVIITKINEYFLKSKKSNELTLRTIILKLMIKELMILEKEIHNLISKRSLIFDILQISIGVILVVCILLHIIGVIDIFVFINKIIL